MADVKTGSAGTIWRRLLRIAGVTRRNAIFTVAFFGSFALLVYAKPNDRVVIIWLLSFIVWAAIIRWWILAGALGGLLFYQPHLHDFDIAGRVFNVVFGALIGACIEAFIWVLFRWPVSRWGGNKGGNKGDGSPFRPRI